MKTNDAMNLLNLRGTVNQKEISRAYKKMAIKFHPDKSPINAQLMKAINAAYATLKKLGDKVTFEISDSDDTPSNYSEELKHIMTALSKLDGLNIEICGNWIWIDGNTKNNRVELRELGCKWARAKKKWFYRPDSYKSFNRGSWNMEKIRAYHGSHTVKNSSRHLWIV